MKITLEQPSYGVTVTVAVDSDDLTIERTIDELIEPALLALGYHPASIKSVLASEDDG
jgi:hypothetical protein